MDIMKLVVIDRLVEEIENTFKLTPYVLVDTKHPDYVGPAGNDNGTIVLDLGYHVQKNVQISGLGITFTGNFGRQRMFVEIPLDAVLMVFAQEDQSIGMQWGRFDYGEAAPKEAPVSIGLVDENTVAQDAPVGNAEWKPTVV